MAIMVGQVECLNIADDTAFMRVRETSTGEDETFILWFNPGSPSAFTRIMHSMWVSMVRDAMSDGREVRVVTPSTTSAFVSSLQLNST